MKSDGLLCDMSMFKHLIFINVDIIKNIMFFDFFLLTAVFNIKYNCKYFSMRLDKALDDREKPLPPSTAK